MNRWLSIVGPMTERDKAERSAVDRKCADLIQQGICPSCRHFETGDVYQGKHDRVYYQDDQLTCMLEAYPRGTGHTIILSNAHYADISEMPVALGCHLMHVTHALVNTLKQLFGAEKVYMHTMCSGRLSHLHFQLIPRLPGEQIGGRVFASDRGVLIDYQATLEALKAEVRKYLQ
jgi:diadenosine tetraphosphate (Ap4A) HIT family hydrolase